LYYRLNVIELQVPPLRKRTADIPVLADHILTQLAERNGINKPSLSDEAMSALQSYPFPGNVRELENILERALTWSDGDRMTVEDLMLPESSMHRVVESVKEASATKGLNVEQAEPSLDSNDLTTTLEDQERQMIVEALEATRWNRTAAAKNLGISFRSLRYKLKKLGID
jgi:two-component system response regulator PilR (NtrC family)